MNRIMKFAVVAAMFLVGTASAYSQDKLMFKVGYSPGFPVGSFTSNTSLTETVRFVVFLMVITH